MGEIRAALKIFCLLLLYNAVSSDLSCTAFQVSARLGFVCMSCSDFSTDEFFFLIFGQSNVEAVEAYQTHDTDVV